MVKFVEASRNKTPSPLQTTFNLSFLLFCKSPDLLNLLDTKNLESAFLALPFLSWEVVEPYNLGIVIILY